MKAILGSIGLLLLLVEMDGSLQKGFLGLIALAVSIIAIELIPMSRQAAYWNRCFDQTNKFLSKMPKLKVVGKAGIQSIAVGICNGAVHEPTITKKDFQD